MRKTTFIFNPPRTCERLGCNNKVANQEERIIYINNDGKLKKSVEVYYKCIKHTYNLNHTYIGDYDKFNYTCDILIGENNNDSLFR